MLVTKNVICERRCSHNWQLIKYRCLFALFIDCMKQSDSTRLLRILAIVVMFRNAEHEY